MYCVVLLMACFVLCGAPVGVWCVCVVCRCVYALRCSVMQYCSCMLVIVLYWMVYDRARGMCVVNCVVLCLVLLCMWVVLRWLRSVYCCLRVLLYALCCVGYDNSMRYIRGTPPTPVHARAKQPLCVTTHKIMSSDNNW